MMKPNHGQRPEPQSHFDPTANSAGARTPRVGVPAVGTLPAGSTFGRYRIDRLIGQGGMGEVYLATETQGNRAVALKIPRLEPGDGDARKRFLRESRTAGSLQHPNICPVFDVGEVGGVPYLTMAYIDGRTLSDHCREGTLLKVRHTAVLVRKIALALVEAHAAGIVHRDLKPENVMIDRNGEPIVMDFGLARSFDDARQTRLTQTGTMMGSPVYMSPEQIQARPDTIGPATDVYSLGVVLYELLTGRVPFDGSIGVIMAKVLTTAVPPPRQFRPEIDERLETICLKMLAKRPSDRIPSMQAVAEAIKQYLTADPQIASAAPAAALPPPAVAQWKPPIPPGLKPLPVNRIAIGIGAAFLLLITLGISAALLQDREKPVAPRDSKVPEQPDASNKRGSGIPGVGDTELTGERYALLVGVRNYAATSGLSNLKYTDADVEGLATVLKSAGYRPENVTVMTQKRGAEELRLLPTRDRVRSELKALLRDRDPHDTVLVAFAGHGVQFKGEPQSYFCPADAQVADKTQSASTLISLEDVYKDLNDSKAGFKLLLCDACRNDPFSSASRRASVDLDSVTRPQRLPPPGGVAAFFSCSEGEVAFEDESVAHGVFFHYIIAGMQGQADSDRDHSVSLDELTAFTKKRVSDFVRGRYDAVRQMPHDIHNTRGTISLAKLDPNRPVTPPESTPPAVPAGTTQKEKTPQTPPTTPPQTPPPGTPPTLGTAGAGTRAGEEWDANGLRMKFCWCPEGSFTMGSPADEKDRGDDENPVQVTLTGFWMGKHEVTQSEWTSVMGTTLASQGDKASRPTIPVGPSSRQSTPKFYGEGPRFPMYYVMHDEATEFCRKLTKQERTAGRLPSGWEYQLPTEAQWEYACRAGTKTRFASGDDEKGAEPYGWFQSNSSLTAHEVGLKKANAWGLHDMHGNIWEWCRDWYAKQLPGGHDPEVSDADAFRVNRGGCWTFEGKDCRSADRFGMNPVLRSYHQGLRATLVRQSQ